MQFSKIYCSFFLIVVWQLPSHRWVSLLPAGQRRRQRELDRRNLMSPSSTPTWPQQRQRRAKPQGSCQSSRAGSRRMFILSTSNRWHRSRPHQHLPLSQLLKLAHHQRTRQQHRQLFRVPPWSPQRRPNSTPPVYLYSFPMLRLNVITSLSLCCPHQLRLSTCRNDSQAQVRRKIIRNKLIRPVNRWRSKTHLENFFLYIFFF